MRVLFVCATGGSGRQQLGGAERFLVEMLPEFAARLEIGALLPEGGVAEQLQGTGVEVLLAGPGKRIDLAYRTSIRAAIRKFNPDIVSAHLLSAAMHTRALSPRDISSSRLVVTLHNSLQQYVDTATADERFKMRFNLFLDRVQRGLRRHTSVAVSKFEADELEGLKFRGPVCCIPNPLPRGYGDRLVSVGHAARKALGLPVEGRLFAYVGRMEYEKGVDMLDAIADGLEDGDILATFGDGILRPRGPRVLNMGRTAKPELIWAAAEAVVVPSRVESFGRVALEAVASGTPVVHTGVGGLNELLSRGEGILAYQTPLDAKKLAANLISASRDKARLEDRRSALAADYLREYAFENTVEKWFAMFEGLAVQRV